MSVIQPLQIGSLVFPTNIIQGPLAGISCVAFRELVWRYGGVAYCCTEMQSSNSIVHSAQQPKRYWYRSPQEKKLCVQLSGHQADRLKKAAETVMDWEADLIDLNGGCPQPKIRHKRSGSALLSNPSHLYALIVAIKTSVDVPVTVKIRVDGDSGEQFNHEVVSAVESAGADALIIHGRHWTERYDVPVRREEIRDLAARVSLPVIANGDVDDYGSLKQMLDETGCDGVMIARGGIGRPWLYQALYQQSVGLPSIVPDLSEVIQLYTDHVQSLANLDGEHKACLQARRLWAYYFNNYELNAEQIQRKNTMLSLKDLQQLVCSLS